MSFQFGEVILVPFPFTDQSGNKKRPAVVVSSLAYQAKRPDLIIMAITGRVRMPLGFGEALIVDWEKANLLKPSLLKPVITSIQQDLVLGSMGRLSEPDLSSLQSILTDCIG